MNERDYSSQFELEKIELLSKNKFYPVVRSKVAFTHDWNAEVWDVH